jgi:acyl-CoA hydrolase
MEKRIIVSKYVNSVRLVKSEDLNHHGTLFAGRTAEWFVESGFIAASTLLEPENIVCLKIHGMQFSSPVRPGAILNFKSKIVFSGRSSIIAYVNVTKESDEKTLVEGFITFIHVNKNTLPTAHNIEIKLETPRDIELYEQASKLKNG